MSPKDFWDSSLLEIQDRVDSYNRKSRAEFKEKVHLIFVRADVIRKFMFPLKDGAEPPHPWDYFSAEFKEEKEQYEGKKEHDELEEYKIRKQAYMERFNREIRKAESHAEQD